MHTSIFSLIVLAPFAVACGASFPPPTQRMADAQSAERSATELGANNVPAARLSVKLAQDQITQAQQAMTEGDNKRADGLLIRAKADAELAIAQARETGAHVAGQAAIDDSAARKATHAARPRCRPRTSSPRAAPTIAPARGHPHDARLVPEWAVR